MGAVIAKTQLDELVFPSATRVVASASASVSDNCASAATWESIAPNFVVHSVALALAV